MGLRERTGSLRGYWAHKAWEARGRRRVLTALRRRPGLQPDAADLLPAQTDLLLQLPDLAVAVVVVLLLPSAHVALHQLDGGDERLGYAEVGVFL